MHIRELNLEFRPGTIRHLCLMTASMTEGGDGEKCGVRNAGCSRLTRSRSE
jgi:hypothetical protein